MRELCQREINNPFYIIAVEKFRDFDEDQFRIRFRDTHNDILYFQYNNWKCHRDVHSLISIW